MENESLLTIPEWKDAQITGNGLERLLGLAQAEREANHHTRAWISIATPAQIQEQWSHLQSLGPDARSIPLYGVPFAAKDNIDAEGYITTAACPAFSSTPATSDSAVVARLKAAGAILIGKTNLDQFATGLVGTRSPHGAVPNAFDPARISGGSSSGSAVVVARGVVPFSLGTDTAGSGRVPAGLNNIVGLKPTRGAISARGVVPACRTLDCVSIFALTVVDAQTVLSAVEGNDDQDAYSRERPNIVASTGFGTATTLAPRAVAPRLAVCATPPWFGRDDHSPAYDEAMKKAAGLGWELTAVDFTPLFQLANLLYDGPWVAERYIAIKDFIESCAPEDMDITVRGILNKAKTFTAADTFAAEYLRQNLTHQIELAMRDFDAILVPTTPTFPTLEQVRQRPVEENSLLGTYTNFVNFLDWTALSVPAGFRSDGLPFGLTLISSCWQEPRLFRLAETWFAHEERLLGATGAMRREPPLTKPDTATSTGYVSIAVVGAHLTGFPLNKDLVSRGATFEKLTTTSDEYRLYALNTTSGPRKPGLRRVAASEDGKAIEVEVWNLPQANLFSFMATIPSPLGIGNLELAGGSHVLGFICEPWGLEGATDISDFGGWRAYMKQHLVQAPSSRISSVLVANRGEIAVRIIKTLHKMSLKAVAIYSDVDVDAAHVHDADVALRLTGSTIAETYLNMSQILNLAVSASVDAVIPGYGFLAEKAEFAADVEAAGLLWIGPTPHQMEELGLKHRSREIAAEANVSTVPGSRQLVVSLEEAVIESQRIGFPLMLKSTAGGGGIGLRHCQHQDDLEAAFAGVQRQAMANFGNGGVFLERFVQHARHIEVQILGDGTGRVVAVGERDCSLQRRHQKVIEESPAFAVAADICEAMKAAAVRLASAVKYRNVGTVEFIYDVDAHEFYFLEVNTRLQVEHPVTESVTGLDMVECMIRIADGHCEDLFSPLQPVTVSGASIEARVYAENPLQGFRPCAGKVDHVYFPLDLRVDTWIKAGTEMTASYDPLMAKLIATGKTRAEAMDRLARGLAETRIDGVQTNLEYLRQIVASEMFQTGEYTTKTLDKFAFTAPFVEIAEPGALSTLQDYPGRTGYWSIGVPPSGPMDDYSHRLANRLVGNTSDAAAIECTLQGPRLKFHLDAVVAVTGARVIMTLDGQVVPTEKGLLVKAGQTLAVGIMEHGYRAYIAVRGGFLVPVVMGSRSTLELGKLGGYSGRKLQSGDLLPISNLVVPSDEVFPSAAEVPIPRGPRAKWTIRVIPGPYGSPDFFTARGLEDLFSSEWRVHHNSNRLGVRLTGARPEWARKTGGEAGLHPSNIHDSPYSVGSVSFTGDEAVVLTCDGPSLGGFVVFCVVISADMWKMGQVRPGDSIRFKPIGIEAALRLDQELSSAIKALKLFPHAQANGDEPLFIEHNAPVIVGHIKQQDHNITVRQAGDRAILLEFGETTTFDLRQSFQIYAFCEQHRKRPIPGVEELTPGVYTLHVIYHKGIMPEAILASLVEHALSYTVPSRVPSRTFRVPLVFNDSVSRAAVERYAATIRSDAPWLPSNIDFLTRLNGLEDGISSILYDATFLVLGIGDVFLGSPCTIPLDPRHRLFGTKYNPSRSFTPRGSVGIGGQYMCIYATDSPGGYQLVGRTVDIWDPLLVSTVTKEVSVNPWMFRIFDRIRFYPVTEGQLDATPADQLVHIVNDSLDLVEYEAWLEKIDEDVRLFSNRQAEAIANAPFVDELCRSYEQTDAPHHVHSLTSGDADVKGERVKAMMPGRCYKCAVKKGDVVKEGDVLVGTRALVTDLYAC